LGNAVYEYSPYSIPGPQGNGENILLLHNIVAPEGRPGVLVDVNTGHGFLAGSEQVVYSWSKYLCFHGNYLEKLRVYLLCFVLFDIFIQELNGSVTHPR
jgi:hypothetical protein